MIIELSSLDQLPDYTSLTDVALRRKLETERGLYMAESTNVIMRAIQAGHAPRSFLTSPRWLADLQPWIERATGSIDGGDVPIYVAEEDVLESITGFHLHRGALAAMNRPVLPEPRDIVRGAHLIVILEGIVDHTNVGAIFRSCAALGADAVLVSPNCADPLYRRSVRVSMGTVFQVPWTRITSWPGGLGQLRDDGWTVCSLALSDRSLTLDQLCEKTSKDSKIALVLGTEGDGLSRHTLAQSDEIVEIPMAGGVDSLNVAAAAAVAIYSISRSFT